jgi:hypothetical protein
MRIAYGFQVINGPFEPFTSAYQGLDLNFGVFDPSYTVVCTLNKRRR